MSADRGGGDETHFTVDRNFALPQLAYETDLGGSLLRRYAYGLGPLSQSSPTDGTFYLHADGLGSISAVTDPAGDPLAWSTYQPFGALRASGADIALPPLAFTGQYLDAATGLYHLRARQYDPATGRFLSTDPVAPALTDPYVATYVYVRNNPVTWTDPTGMARERPARDPVFRLENHPSFNPFDPAFKDPFGTISFWPFEGCDAGSLGFGLGLIIGGAALDIASSAATAASAGTLTPLTGAGVVAGTSSVITGLGLVGAAC